MSDIRDQAKDLFYEMLLESDVGVSPKKIPNQVRDLKILSDCLHEIAKVNGGVGMRPFHNAMRLASSIDYAIGNLTRIDQLIGTLEALKDAL